MGMIHHDGVASEVDLVGKERMDSWNGPRREDMAKVDEATLSESADEKAQQGGR